ncbi:MAG TPA: hypothetical protein DCM68_08900 [Verrucomicrobia bacterium]|nr:hypothetical protein [Verrucomicrobiota bacterium]
MIPAAAVRGRAWAWLLVAAWTGMVFLTIPVARKIQGVVESMAGPRIYLAAAEIVGLAFALGVSIHLLRTPGASRLRRAAWLVALGGIASWTMHTQLQTPIEAIHFIEYGVLAFLLFRAWRHHLQDPFIYPISLLSLVLIAWVDEFLQWLTPERFWDFRDIRLNGLAGALLLLVIARVLSPAGIRRPVDRRSVRWGCGLAWLTLLAFGFAISNTPARVDSYAGRIPFLRFLYHNESVMNEFGHRHVDPEIGVFFSRMSLPELQRTDAETGLRAGETLARDPGLAGRREFRKAHPVSAHPFLIELWEHWTRRNHYFAVCWKYREADPARFAGHLAVAMRENQILEKYFPQALDAAGGRWPESRKAEAARLADVSIPYVSAVDSHLVTRATEGQLWALLLALAGLAGWGYARHGRAPAA